jgi:retinol-binding protein 3
MFLASDWTANPPCADVEAQLLRREEFTYNLKNLKRATIIGETTGGGAHPVSGHRIDDHFMIGVPFARAINPISKTNWEEVGVEPDVKVPAAEALSTAQRLAMEKRSAK